MAFTLSPFHRDVPDEQLLADLKSAHGKLQSLGKALTFRNYANVGAYSPSTVATRFGSWNQALQRAGLTAVEEKYVAQEALFDNLRDVWIAKGTQPTFRDMGLPPSKYTASTYSARFGGWRNALKAFSEAYADEEHAVRSEAVALEKTASSVTGRNPSLALRFHVLKRDSFRCVACGRSPATHPGLVLEVDHSVAWSKGGATVADNLRTLCFDCNRGKGGR
jgi:hypothetical protein